MLKLVLLRHGESRWNRENRFTGWSDVDLTDTGRREAQTAARAMRNQGIIFDAAYVSLLKRAIHTLWQVQDVMDQAWIPVTRDWRLNERHYGALQGLSKSEIADHYGAARVHEWRRSFHIQPPPLGFADPRHPRFDPRYRKLCMESLPATESLADTMVRVLVLWRESILPDLRAGKTLLIAAHGNSLRALVKYLDRIHDDDISELNIPTGVPLVYEFDDNLSPMTHYYLPGDSEHRVAA